MGESKHDGLAIPGRVVLAHEPSFTLGALHVQPALRQISSGGNSETLEPRVMQALVALARADGQIVTRDELIERCWDGRIVTDDAINRVLSRIRQVANGIGNDSFGVETIARVGYRLVATGPTKTADPPPAPVEPARLSRRIAMVTAAAATITAGAVGAGLYLNRPPKYQPTPRAQALFAKGIEARGIGTGETSVQAEAYFRQAVEADPMFADAWGALALQMQFQLGGGEGLAEIAQRATSAADRALALQPDQPDALAALALIPSSFRRWGESEQALLSVRARAPKLWLVEGLLGHLYANTGRWEDSVTIFRRVTSGVPFNPGPAIMLAFVLWGAGRFVEAEAQSRAMLDRWPRNTGVWLTHMTLLSYAGRPDEAVAFGSDRAAQPYGDQDLVIDTQMLTTRALASRSEHDLRAAIESLDGMAAKYPWVMSDAALLFAATGHVDEAFDRLDEYLFRRGRTSNHPITRWTRLDTYFLFLPPMLPLWRDARFEQRMRAIGLDNYWRQTATVPDYRKA
ncbi:MAG TPA: winged helix-turn-helix domain-containing protein [Sphingomicrobium sp.]|nr:winged helix-turn-helix domain-containing protein [Sphingomicrobium sp.]